MDGNDITMLAVLRERVKQLEARVETLEARAGQLETLSNERNTANLTNVEQLRGQLGNVAVTLEGIRQIQQQEFDRRQRRDEEREKQAWLEGLLKTAPTTLSAGALITTAVTLARVYGVI